MGIADSKHKMANNCVLVFPHSSSSGPLDRERGVLKDYSLTQFTYRSGVVNHGRGGQLFRFFVASNTALVLFSVVHSNYTYSPQRQIRLVHMCHGSHGIWKSSVRIVAESSLAISVWIQSLRGVGRDSPPRWRRCVEAMYGNPRIHAWPRWLTRLADWTFARQKNNGYKFPQTIAHRGYRAKHPENTMDAFIGAVKAGAHAIETDIHLSKDGVVVISHVG